MKITSADYLTSAVDMNGCPADEVPEFALIGRSNVGKSSLLNMITGRTDLARVSETPGKTQMLNFFTINRKWRLVDLPGYGYAKVSKTAASSFNQVAADYLGQRQNLVCALVLIDSRLPPQPIDLEFINWMIDRSRPFVIVFTKADKPNSPALKENIALFEQELGNLCEELPEMFVTSSKAKAGHRELHKLIASALTY